MAKLNTQLTATLSEHLYANNQLAYLRVDRDLVVREVSANCELYLGKAPRIGERVDDAFDCMVGLDFSDAVSWPIIESDDGLAMTLNVLHVDDYMHILMTDASEAIAQRRTLQQAANQNELLLIEKQKLLKTLEQKTTALEQASRLQNAFLAGVAHEFRTPLVSTLGYAELLQKELASGDVSTLSAVDSKASEPHNPRQWINGIERSSQHLLSLIENLLDHGKSQSEQLQLSLQAVNLADLLQDVQFLLKPQAQQKGLDLVVEMNGSQTLSECWLMADPSRLRQCLINLVSNAVKFTDQGKVTLCSQFEDGILTLSVEDTGLGMSDAELAMVREPFWQANHSQRPGTGLGVTITDSIVELMGGELRIESSLGQGTSATIELPLTQVSAPETQKLTLSQLTKSPCTLLMVEDDDDIALMLDYVLSEAGFTVSRSADYSGAVDLVEKQQFDIVLMDVVLPVKDGFETASLLRSKGVSAPIVMMSASEQEFAARNPEGLNHDAYLLKPIAAQDVVALANELVLGD